MDICCTITQDTSPSLIRRLAYAGATHFRLNLSHFNIEEEVWETAERIRGECGAMVVADTHGHGSQPTPFDVAVMENPNFQPELLALSFAQNEEDIRYARRWGNGALVIAKIEDAAGYENRASIIEAADGVMIDRFDISKAMPDVPKAVRFILDQCVMSKTSGWVATDVLGSMRWNPQPNQAERHDVQACMRLGAGGFVFSGETAVGKYPLQCVEELVKEIAKSMQ